RGLWRHRPTSVGVLCLARFGPEDNKRYRPRQTLATHAETPRGSGQSRRESLVTCISKYYKLACNNYTLSPIMSNVGRHGVRHGYVRDPIAIGGNHGNPTIVQRGNTHIASAI